MHLLYIFQSSCGHLTKSCSGRDTIEAYFFFFGASMTGSTSFNQLPLQPALLDTLEQLGFTQMTDIQAQSLPLVLEGQDVIAQAKTGSGKTAAFGLGLLQKINPQRLRPQALVLCPTRELATQVADEIRRLARAIPNVKVMVITGGVPMQRQVDSLAHGVHIIVGTPGRILDHIDAQSIDFRGIHSLVLDEADRMIDMGFYDDMAQIVAACPTHRQTLLFSATYPDTIGKDATLFVRDAVHVTVETQVSTAQIEQYFYHVPEADRFDAVVNLLLQHNPSSALLFCNTKANCDSLTYYLRSLGFSALVLHGDLDQRDRDEVLIQFANQSCTVLVATDVAARGLDISGLPMVMNVELPRQTEVYIHRIGRTGRVDQQGLVLSLCEDYNQGFLDQLVKQTAWQLDWSELPQNAAKAKPVKAPMQTLVIIGGKRDKLRPGDILGALTGDAGLTRDQVGKINVGMVVTHVALDRRVAQAATNRLRDAGIKGKAFRMHFVR